MAHPLDASHRCSFCLAANFSVPGPQLAAYPASSYPTLDPPKGSAPHADFVTECSKLDPAPAYRNSQRGSALHRILLLRGEHSKARRAGQAISEVLRTPGKG